MSAKKRKSKKLSVANSKQPPKQLEPFVLYLDRNLGKHVVAEALRNAGQTVEIHDDHLPIDASDEDWIQLVGKQNWIALTKDKNIRYRFAEIDAIRRHGARVLVLRAKNITGAVTAEILVNSIDKIQKFAAKTDAPFVAGIDRTGKITSYDT